MNAPARRTVLVATVVAVLAVSGTAVAVGFHTGWLTTNTNEHPVGRLRPADLTADLTADVSQPPDLDATTSQPAEPIQPATNPTTRLPAATPANPPSDSLAPPATYGTDVTTAPPSTPAHETNDHDADD
jgi:hypothetical protein